MQASTGVPSVETRRGSGFEPRYRTEGSGQTDDLIRAVTLSVVNRAGETLSLEVESERQALEISTRVELMLMKMLMRSGGTSARVAPSALDDTYPAMRSLTEALDASDAHDLWHAADGRTVKLANAAQIFVSMDRPVRSGSSDGTSRPDTLLEIVSAHRIPADWYRARVAPKANRRGLTKVFYGMPMYRCSPGKETLFDRVRRVNLTREWRDGAQRHFSALRAAGATAA